MFSLITFLNKHACQKNVFYKTDSLISGFVKWLKMAKLNFCLNVHAQVHKTVGYPSYCTKFISVKARGSI